MIRRPMFIVSTEDHTPGQMKASARRAFDTYRAAADDDALPFLALLIGREPQRFVTLQEAMSSADGIGGVTGVLQCLGVDVVRYDGGTIELTDGLASD